MPRKAKIWTPEEDQILTANVHKQTIQDIIPLLQPGTTRHAVIQRIKQLGLTKQPWTPEEDKKLTENNLRRLNGEINRKQLAKLFPNRTEQAIKDRIKTLNLPRARPRCTPRPKLRPKDKINYLTLIEKIPAATSPTGHTRWKCQCICGKEITIDANTLTDPKNPPVSCGCYRKQKNTDPSKIAQCGVIANTNTKTMKKTTPNKNNKTGYRNIRYWPERNKYIVTIRFKGKSHSLGYYVKLEDAIKARDRFKAAIMPEIEALDAERQAQIPDLVNQFKAKFHESLTNNQS